MTSPPAGATLSAEVTKLELFWTIVVFAFTFGTLSVVAYVLALWAIATRRALR
jgi:hypothetical protein